MKKNKYGQKMFFLCIMGLSLSLVSSCGDDGDEPIKITITDGEYVNDHKAVDLGLSVKWATCNVGADSPEESGGYYAWGETVTKSESYEYEDVNIGDDITGTEYDVAHISWGSTWRMPTREEIDELCDSCSWEWTTYNGMKGQLVTGPNGNNIFLPAAGTHKDSGIEDRGKVGYYWATAFIKYNNCASIFFFNSGGNGRSAYRRNFGISVRPVTE